MFASRDNRTLLMTHAQHYVHGKSTGEIIDYVTYGEMATEEVVVSVGTYDATVACLTFNTGETVNIALCLCL